MALGVAFCWGKDNLPLTTRTIHILPDGTQQEIHLSADRTEQVVQLSSQEEVHIVEIPTTQGDMAIPQGEENPTQLTTRTIHILPDGTQQEIHLSADRTEQVVQLSSQEEVHIVEIPTTQGDMAIPQGEENPTQVMSDAVQLEVLAAVSQIN
uniref:Uncharacterized protein n=1 Tax=Branchiostoma floridae TaxID=7739 RepID=C3ZHX8_BRAFL|eukprot:XP_002591822.1 hypothetical protein BRAFLDRAFT_88766 [Branchiostoma floridae]